MRRLRHGRDRRGERNPRLAPGADALSIDIVEVDRWSGGEGVDEDFCTVAFADGQPVNVELISPRDHLALLTRAAEQFDLDAEALQAAARSALAAPDRAVVLDVHGRGVS